MRRRLLSLSASDTGRGLTAEEMHVHDSQQAHRASTEPLLRVRPVLQTARLDTRGAGGGSYRAFAPGQGRQGPHTRGMRPFTAAAGRAGGLSHRAGARLRHRGHGDGHVVAARRPRRGRAGLGELRRRLGLRHHQAAEARGCPRAHGRIRASCPTSGQVDFATTWCSPGTAPPRVCGCPTATGSPTSARAWPSATPPRRCSPWTCPWDKLDVVT